MVGSCSKRKPNRRRQSGEFHQTPSSALRSVCRRKGHMKLDRMITRKRGRLDSSSAPESLGAGMPCKTDTSTVRQISLDEDLCDSPSSPSVELDELLNTDDLDWVFDRDAFAPLGDLDPFYSLSSNDRLDQGASATEMTRSSMESSQRRLSGHTSNKNAIAARMNRLKKKEYVSGLEQKVGSLTTENRFLQQENGQLHTRVEELENETRYLRAVLANESMLAQLLSRLTGVSGMKFSTSLFQGPDKNDHDYAMPTKRVKVEERDTSGGVCLHVDKDHVSVEFCTKCAESANASIKMWLCLAG
ncbi:CREB/ATF bZIP transcription factor isoform X2 [Denticeps clupeoides]|nr:CREB/ATF bZIP transcription factor isoform X2 [Denticeps clupeoides]